MNKTWERILYGFGINVSGYNVARELDYLKKKLPKNYKNKIVTDLGCGDGKISQKLIPILEPQLYIGIDASAALIKKAKKRGINCRIGDIEKLDFSGDLGIMWGVLHHLNNPIATLKLLKKKFKKLIIRESIDDSRWFELGHKWNEDILMNIVKKADITAKKIITIKENKSVIIFVEEH